MTKSTALTIKMVLEGIYKLMMEKPGAQEYEINVSSEVADDSDWHRTRKGSLHYSKALHVHVGNRGWIIAVSTGPRGYPADQFATDLLVYPMEVSEEKITTKKIEEYIRKKVSYFNHSPIIGLASGDIAVSQHSMFYSDVELLFKGGFNRFVEARAEYNQELMHLDGRPIVQKQTTYQPEFINFWFDALEQILSKK